MIPLLHCSISQAIFYPKILIAFYEVALLFLGLLFYCWYLTLLCDTFLFCVIGPSSVSVNISLGDMIWHNVIITFCLLNQPQILECTEQKPLFQFIIFLSSARELRCDKKKNTYFDFHHTFPINAYYWITINLQLEI